MIIWIFPLVVGAGLVLAGYLMDRGGRRSRALEDALVPVRLEPEPERRTKNAGGGRSSDRGCGHGPRGQLA